MSDPMKDFSQPDADLDPNAASIAPPPAEPDSPDPAPTPTPDEPTFPDPEEPVVPLSGGGGR